MIRTAPFRTWFLMIGIRKSEIRGELEKQIKEFANTRLSDYKWVRIIEFVDEMPKTISGKVRKAKQRTD